MKSKLTFLLVFTLFAQFANAQVFGIKGGMNVASMTFSSSGMDFSPKSIIGLQIGPVAEFELQESLYFNTGLLYSLKGYKIKMDFMGENVDVTSKLNYLEVPLNFAYKFETSETSKFFVQAGPYLGYALSGKSKGDGESVDIEFGDGGMKRFDLGVGIGLGLEFGPLVPSVSYQLGLANLSDDSDVKVKNQVFQVSVAYMFGK
ncbi:MAG: PorT family protein [Prolixibacteraceae bacterium]|nr:PorT family protein [Prolixibacteraceae bacterium]